MNWLSGVWALLNRNRFLKGLLAVVATIFLGAIGSGLWDVLLGPAFHKLSSLSLGIMFSLFHGYADHVYSHVSRDPMALLSLFPYMALVVGGGIFFPWGAIVFMLRTITRAKKRILPHDEEEDVGLTPVEMLKRLDKARKLVFTGLLPLALISSLLYAEELIDTIHATDAYIFVDRSLEILAPHIDESQRLQLRAQLRSIESASDFYALEDSIRSIASTNHLKLPNFKSVR
jgi:hypothetical protein